MEGHEGASTGWLREAVVAFWAEAVLYARTAAGFARRPRRFLDEWVAGRRRAQNPLGFMATTLALTASLQLLRRSLPGATDSSPASASPLWNGLLESVGPYAHYLVLGLVSHAVLRLLRTRGQLLGSVAATLYSGGIALLVITVLFFAAALTFPGLRRSGTVSHADRAALAAAIAAFAASYALFAVLLVASLGRLHHAPWRAGLGVGAAIVAIALAFGNLNPPGHYGLHPSLKIVRNPQGRFAPELSLNLG